MSYLEEGAAEEEGRKKSERNGSDPCMMDNWTTAFKQRLITQFHKTPIVSSKVASCFVPSRLEKTKRQFQLLISRV